MKYRLIISMLASFLVAFSVSAAPKPKAKDVMLSSYVRYQGYMVKKSPCGEGVFGVYYSKDLSKMDVVGGKFNGNNVSDATLAFSHDGPIFKGELTYEVKEDCIVYTMLKGTLSGSYTRNSQKVPFVISIDKPTSITRTYINHSLSQLTFSSVETLPAREYRNDLNTLQLSEKTKLQRVYELVEGLEGCSGFTQTYERQIIISGLSKVVGKDGYYTCNRFDLSNGAYVLYENGGYELQNSKNYLLWGSKDIILKKAFDNSMISYSKSEDVTFVATKSYMENFNDVFKEYYTAETLAELNKVKYTPEYEISTKPLKCLRIEYSDGRKYYGVLKAKSGFKSVTDFFTKIKVADELPSEESYRDGLLTYPDGRQEVYVKGNTLDQLLEYSQKKEAEVLQKEAEEKAALAKKIEEVNLRLILGEPGDIRSSLAGNIRSINISYDDMCLYLGVIYNKDGRVAKTWSSADLSTEESTYHYDAQGRIDYSMSSYQYADTKPEKTQIKYFYDDMGRLIRMETYKKTTLLEKTEYTYNSNGDAVDAYGNITPIDYTRPSSYRRQYDNRGNIIREVRDDEPIIYEIEYWD